MAKTGASVAAIDRDPAVLESAVESLRRRGFQAEAFCADVSSSTDISATVDQIERDIGPIDMLVNAAGILRLGEARTLTDEDWLTTLSVNATGVFYVSRAVANHMVSRRRGSIVTVASNAAGTPRVGMAAYAASKAAATIFTKCLGLGTAKHGIRCNVVAPGSTETRMLRSLWKDDDGPRGSIDGVPGEYRVGIPLGRLGQPSDIAASVLFLLSDQAAHITMHELTVDGGASLGV